MVTNKTWKSFQDFRSGLESTRSRRPNACRDVRLKQEDFPTMLTIRQYFHASVLPYSQPETAQTMSLIRSNSWLLIPLACVMTGCVGIQGSGVSKTETREVTTFHAVNNECVGDVTIQIGSPQSVTVTFDDNLLELVETSVVDGELKINTTENYNSKVGLKVEITVPDLDQLRLSGVGSIKATGIDNESLKIRQSGVGSLKVAGKTKSVDLSVSGVGSADLSGLEAEKANAVVSGVGAASVFASESIVGKVSGVGGLTIHGNPKEKDVKADGIGGVSYK
ncbi:MAG: DUF2807 domain-containing protein [Planctomycetaceae bacterium]|nr:DUF2807 domain-containing protein [Planctomycetaceae bacterium]